MFKGFMPLSSEINPEDGGSMFVHNCDTVQDPDDIKMLSLGAIWNFGKGTGLS